MGQFKTTIRLSWDDLDLLTAYQTAKDIPVRTEAIMRAVKEACVREKITIAMLPENMRASYYLAAENLAIKTPIKEEGKEEKKGTDSGKQDDDDEKLDSWGCPLENFDCTKQKTIDDCRACPSLCEHIAKCASWALKEILAERAKLKPKKEPVPKKPESMKVSKTEVVEKPEPKEEEPVTPTQATPKPTPEKRPETLRMGASEPQQPSVIEEAPKYRKPGEVAINLSGLSPEGKVTILKAIAKDEAPKVQPGMEVSKTDVDPDIEVQPATIIKTLRERAVSKPKTRGQQTLGDDNP